MKKIEQIVEKAINLSGLTPQETETLLLCNEKNTQELVLEAAKIVKNKIYGKRIVLFAPLYFSNACVNNCLYCGFRKKNRLNDRKTLTLAELAEETKVLINTGVKRILFVSSENDTIGVDRIAEAIECCYRVKTDKGEIRRINVNIAPLTTNEFKKLKAAKIGTYQLFQETYDRNVYKKMHPNGPKSDFNFRYEAPFRAMEAGIEDIGMGVLFGLANPVQEIKSLLIHIAEMEKIFGVGPHTISVPRIKPAEGASLSFNPPYVINDDFFVYIVAVLRLAVPYTGIILSTRENSLLRDRLFGVGVSQISAASSTTPGGYQTVNVKHLSQFSTSDSRSLEEIVITLCEMGYIPSFCTACYRNGRVGEDFMQLAKTGDIKTFCNINAALSLLEYAVNFLDGEKRERVLNSILTNPEFSKDVYKNMFQKVLNGEKDVYV